MALKCAGAHDPSGLAAPEWKWLSSSFVAAPNDLCSTIVAVTHSFSVSYILIPVVCLPLWHAD